MDDVEKRVIGKVMRRLIPFLILCYFVAYLDRVNVGFAKLHMNQALGLSEAAFGLDRPHHDYLGNCLGGFRIHPLDIGQHWNSDDRRFLFSPSIARRLRGGLLSGHYLLSDLVVPGGIPRPGHQPFHAGDPDFVHHRVTDFRTAARRDGLGAGRVAMAFHPGSVALDSGRHRRFGLSDRFPAPGRLVAER
jgi:hypothetical protein